MQVFLITLALLLPFSNSGVREPGAEVRIELRPRVEPKAPLTGAIVLRSLEGQGDLLRLPLGSGSLLAKLPANTQWLLTAEIPGYWSPEVRVSLASEGGSSTHPLVLWPTGKLAGSFKMLDPGEKLPKSFEIRIESPPVKAREREIPRGSVTCHVDDQGAWTCEVPAGILDLAFRAAGFIPHYRWDLKIASGKDLPLGSLALRRGASLAGWVEVEGGTLEAGKCIARLAPLLAPGQGKPQVEARLRGATLEQVVTKEGFFQLQGVAPGTYRIEVEQPGYAPARAFPLDVWDRSETVLKQPFILKRPLDLEFSISPPLDWLGRPWRVSVQRRSDFSAGLEPESGSEGTTDAQGRFRVPGQTPGRFRVHVADSRGNGFYSAPDTRVERPEDTRQSIEIRLVSVQGKVALGSESLASTLWFGGEHGSVSVRLETDEEGEFEGTLPRDGAWRVQVRAQNPPVSTHVKAAVKANDRGEASLDIVLPDTLVFGKVVDEGGRAVSKAQVHLSSVVSGTSLEAGADGTFELRAFPEGKVVLSARSSSPEGPQVSDETILEAMDSRPVGPVHLVLRKMKVFSGRIRSLHGPVAGAMVAVWPLQPSMGITESVRTGLDGRFSVNIPGKADRVAVVVSPPGGALKAFDVPVIPDPVVLQVTDEGGDLEVLLPFSPEEAAEKGLVFAVLQNGVMLSPSVLYRWAAGHGADFRTTAGLQVPRLAPGSYEVCAGPTAITEDAEVGDWKSQRATCATGDLGNGSRLRLEIKKPR